MIQMSKLNFDKIIPVLERNDVAFAGVFGSFAKGEAGESSDIDILVKFKEPKSLFNIIGLEMELSQILNRKVDLVTERALCPHIKESVLTTLHPLYGQR